MASDTPGTWKGTVFTAPGIKLRMKTAVNVKVSANLRADGWVETVLPGTSTTFAEQPVGPIKGISLELPKSKGYKEFTFPDGYTYRQYPDGSILIAASPYGGAGTKVEQSGKYAKAWSAIDAQIRAKKDGNTQKAASTALAVASVLLATLTPKQRGQRRMPDPDAYIPPPPPAGPPFLLIGGGIAAVVAVLFVLGRSR